MKGEGKRSGTKCLAYVAAFIVFQAAVIVILAFTVMRFKNPKVRFGSVTVDTISTSNTTTSPSFNMRLMTQFTVKNTNFGSFKYDSSTLTILYGGASVGSAAIPNGSAKLRQTKKFDVTVDISSDQLSGNNNLGSDINSGVLTLTSEAKLNGKVELMKIIKKKKSGQMNCTIAINLMTRAVGFNCD